MIFFIGVSKSEFDKFIDKLSIITLRSCSIDSIPFMSTFIYPICVVLHEDNGQIKGYPDITNGKAELFRKSLINFLCEILAFGKIEAYGILVVFAEWQQSGFYRRTLSKG